MTLQSDVPVLTFSEENVNIPPCFNDPIAVRITSFYVTINYPNDDVDKFALGSNYDTAIEQYLAMVESYRHFIQ